MPQRHGREHCHVVRRKMGVILRHPALAQHQGALLQRERCGGRKHPPPAGKTQGCARHALPAEEGGAFGLPGIVMRSKRPDCKMTDYDIAQTERPAAVDQDGFEGLPAVCPVHQQQPCAPCLRRGLREVAHSGAIVCRKGHRGVVVGRPNDRLPAAFAPQKEYSQKERRDDEQPILHMPKRPPDLPPRCQSPDHGRNDHAPQPEREVGLWGEAIVGTFSQSDAGSHREQQAEEWRGRNHDVSRGGG